MSKWRKECESERKRALAEEGEVRRLRAENRILQNRIQSLEKENNSLAHNLIQVMSHNYESLLVIIYDY